MPTNHIVKPGENLTHIARKYGYSDWRIIYNAVENRAFRIRRHNPDRIFPGDVIVIPDKPSTAAPPPPSKVEFSFTILDTVSGRGFASMDVSLRLDDGLLLSTITDKDGSITLTEPTVTIDSQVSVVDMADGRASPPIDYSGSGLSGLSPNSSHVIHVTDRRAVADSIATKFSISRRAAWGKKTPDYSAMAQDWDYEIVALHHSGGSGESDPVKIEQIHMDKRHWQDVGYHYIIQPSGAVFEGRHVAFEGSHVELANTHKIGILITGDFDPSLPLGPFSAGDPTADQLRVAGALIIALKGVFPITKLGGHRDYKSTTVCPGDNLYTLIPSLRIKTALGGP